MGMLTNTQLAISLAVSAPKAFRARGQSGRLGRSGAPVFESNVRTKVGQDRRNEEAFPSVHEQPTHHFHLSTRPRPFEVMIHFQRIE
jgi:hypothetical protein